MYAAGRLDTPMQTVLICQAFGWTYDQYLDQPIHFLLLIAGRMQVDAQKAARDAKKTR